MVFDIDFKLFNLFFSLYSRLKEYITYISTPSQSPADARLKQQMADKIFELMRQEEVKLVEKRPLSSQLGNFFSFIWNLYAKLRQI